MMFSRSSLSCLLKLPIKNFTTRLTSRGYPNNLVDKIISVRRKKERSYTNTESAQKNSTLCDTISSITSMFENILMEKWHLIQNQPLLREIYKDPPLISYRKGKTLKDMLVKAKLLRLLSTQ